jgi:saccharopine dehydrogenase (NAD+, L-lysine-forming)
VRILVVGAGGVGSAVAAIARRRSFFESLTLTDLDGARAQASLDRLGPGGRVGAMDARALDASDPEAIAALARELGADTILNACDPRLNPPIFEAAFEAGCTYLDMAMTLSRPHPERPYQQPGTLLGEEQFIDHERWEMAGQLALVGIGVEPGFSDVAARYAADHLFSEIDELGVRDGADLVVAGYDFAPTFSIWTTIEECLNPPLVWERERGFFTTEPFSEPELFTFPEGIGPIECVNVEHEEVVLMPRWIDARRVTFKYGLGEEFIDVLRTLHKLGLDSTEPIDVRGASVAPRDVVAAALPNPATLGDRMTGRTCAGTLVTGTGTDGAPRATYLYHVVDNERTMREDGSQAVVWQTAINPVVALELIAEGVWSGAGVLGPEAFDAVPFLDLLADYGAPHGVDERDPADPQAG